MNGGVKLLKLLVLGICKERYSTGIYECVFNLKEVLVGPICFTTLPII